MSRAICWAITPLGIAIENALPAVVDALLAAGADPDLRSGPNACPPLALAATQASEKTISTTLPDAMVRAGAPVLNFDASGIDTSGLGGLRRVGPGRPPHK